MAGQRSKDKAHLGGYVPKGLADIIAGIASNEGKDKTAIMVELLDEAIKARRGDETTAPNASGRSSPSQKKKIPKN